MLVLEIVGVLYLAFGLAFAVHQWRIDTKFLADSYALFVFQMLMWPLFFLGDND